MAFIRATREQIHLRAALLGPAGSGKTITALFIAKGLGGRTAVVDTEHGSARRYAHMFEFDTLELDTFAPEVYERAIHEAENAGYDNLILDSLSHAWVGKGGILEFVDNVKRKGENAFTSGWRDATPKHNSLVETMLAARLNLIVTMRVKMDYVLEPDERGKVVPRKVGLQPVQREGLEYEFDLVGDMDLNHNLIVSKSRFFDLADKVYQKPTDELGRLVLSCIASGQPATEKPKAEQAQPPAESKPAESKPAESGGITDYQIKEIAAVVKELGMSKEELAAFVRKNYERVFLQLSAVHAAELLSTLKLRLRQGTLQEASS